ncbi:MAG: hypothetical protein RL173_2431 [Fibrobacterota bacterium]|jgi:two-component system chemotaxis sensor kinase CheA
MSEIEDAGILQEFREEAGDHLATLESVLLAMERDGISTDDLNRIFRSAHSIKGAAGFLGLTGIGAVSHAAETVLSLLRDGKMTFGKGVAASLLSAVDVLRRLLEAAPGDGGVDSRPIVGQLEGLLDPPTAASVMEESEEFHELGARGRSMSTTTFRLRQIPSNHRHQYILCYTKGELSRRQAVGQSPVALVRELQKLGHLVDDKLQEVRMGEVLPDEAVSILVLFSTDLEPTHIAKATNLPLDCIQELDLGKLLADIAKDESSLLREFEPGVPPPPLPPKALPRTKPQPTVLHPDPMIEVRPAIPDKAGNGIPEAPAAPAVGTHETPNPSATETVRVRLDVLDRLMRLAGELVLVRNRQLSRLDGASIADRETSQRLDQVTAGIQDAVLSARMQPLGNVLSKFQRIVRDLGHKLQKEIALNVEGGETELDRTLLEALADPLTHIVRNCCDHGIEKPADRVRAGKPAGGTVSVKAWHEAGRVRIRIKDDGKGIDANAVRAKALEKGLRAEDELSRMTDREVRQLVFLPGFSTAASVTDLSGRGVGMDVVRSAIERLGGAVTLDSEPGSGTTLDLQLPLTLAIVPALVVVSRGCRFAIPQASVDELVRLYDEDVERIESAGREDLYRLREHLLPLVSLGHVLSSREPLGADDRAAFSEADRVARTARLDEFRKGERVAVSETFAVLKAGEGRFGLILDKILGTEEIVVEPLHQGLGNPGIYAGATVLGDGEIALILDTQGVCRHAGLQPADLDASVVGAHEQQALGMLLFRAGPDEQLGLPLSALRRVVRLRSDEIERSGEREYVQLEERSVRVERLDRHLSLSLAPAQQDGFLLLPSGDDRSWGILASALVDSGEYRFRMDESPEEGSFVRGTALLRGHRTLLLDESRLRQELSR